MARFDLGRLFRVPTPDERLADLELRPDLARAALDMAADPRSERELLELERSLLQSESVVMVVEGRHRRQLGMLALTTERVLFRPHGATAGRDSSVPLAEISAADSEVGSMTGRVVLACTGSAFQVDKVLGLLAPRFADAVRRQLTEPLTR